MLSKLRLNNSIVLIAFYNYNIIYHFLILCNINHTDVGNKEVGQKDFWWTILLLLTTILLLVL